MAGGWKLEVGKLPASNLSPQPDDTDRVVDVVIGVEKIGEKAKLNPFEVKTRKV